MKTTVDLPDELLIEAKKRAAETRTSKISWVTAPGGLPPGLDVSDRVALWEWKERQR